MGFVHGTFNVAKCAEYLRSVGADVTDEQVQQWHDAEKVHRWLRRERKQQRAGYTCVCRNGHRWVGVFDRRRGKKVQAANEAASKCPECGQGWCMQSALWFEARDGSVKDWRPVAERWKPLPGFAEASTNDAGG